MQRTFYSVVTMLIAVVLLVACGQNDLLEVDVIAEPDQEPTETAATNLAMSDVTVALVMKTLTNPFFLEMEKGARRAAEDLGINLVVRTGSQEASEQQQVTIIETMIAEGAVDALVISPIDSVRLAPVLKQAQEAGIVIINIDERLDQDTMVQANLDPIPFVGVDNEFGGYQSAKYIADQITEPTDAFIIEGTPNAISSITRKTGALRAFEENENINLVGIDSAQWDIVHGYEVSKQLFTTYPNVKVVFAANDLMALGTIQYLQEAGRTDVLISAYDAIEAALQAVADGTLQATVNQRPDEQAYTGITYAVQALQGEEIPAETMIDVELITSDNLPDTTP